MYIMGEFSRDLSRELSGAWIIFHNVTYRQTILFLRGRGWLGNFFLVRFFSPLVFAEKFFATYTLAGIIFFFEHECFFHIFLPQPTLHELIIQSQTHRNSYGNTCCIITGSRTIHWHWKYLRATLSNKIFVETGLEITKM